MLPGSAPVLAASTGLIIAGVVGAMMGGVLWVLWQRRDHLVLRNFGAVEPEAGLFRSARLTPATLDRLVKQRGVKTVVDLGAYPPDSKEEAALQDAARRLGITRHVVRGLRGNGTGNINGYIHAVRLMRDAGARPLLVHCAAGAERTTTAVALYQHVERGTELHKAVEAARAFKHDPDENPYLLAFLKSHVDAAVRALREGGWVPGAAPPEVTIAPGRPAPAPAATAVPSSAVAQPPAAAPGA